MLRRHHENAIFVAVLSATCLHIVIVCSSLSCDPLLKDALNAGHGFLLQLATHRMNRTVGAQAVNNLVFLPSIILVLYLGNRFSPVSRDKSPKLRDRNAAVEPQQLGMNSARKPYYLTNYCSRCVAR